MPYVSGRAGRAMLNTLSGRFLILTTLFVMLAEVLIFVPSVARFREDYLLSRLERAQIASLAVLASDMIEPEVEEELLRTAGVFNVVLRRDELRQLVLSSPIPEPIFATYDLRDPTSFGLIADAMAGLLDGRDRVIRVIGDPVREAGLLIEVTMKSGPLRVAMIDYGVRILALSAIISLVTALLLFLAVRRLLVTPIRGVVNAMARYAAEPEDARNIIAPTAGVRELREAEDALQSMQTQLTGALRQKERLAQLGAAVAKISHDLRNILTTAQLLADRMEGSDDPRVARAAPRLVASIQRAVSLCEGTLAFGRAEEPPPKLALVRLADVASEVVEGERLAAPEGVRFRLDVPGWLTARADAEQLSRVLVNLVRNARQAIEGAGGAGEIAIEAQEAEDGPVLIVSDTGPGLPERARENLFTAFRGGTRKGGSGLGLVIAAELVRGHGGRLTLERTGPDGTSFAIRLPRADALGIAAQ